MSQVEPGAIRAALPKSAPEAPEPFEAIFARSRRADPAGPVAFQPSRILRLFPRQQRVVVGARRLSLDRPRRARPVLAGGAGADRTRGGRRSTGCASSSALPTSFSGVIQDTASTSTLVALICARERASDFSLARGGIAGLDAPLIVYGSAHAHSFGRQGGAAGRASAATTCGTSRPTPRYAIRPEALEAAIRADLAAGREPAAIVADRRHDRRHGDRSRRRDRRDRQRATACGCMSMRRWRARR